MTTLSPTPAIIAVLSPSTGQYEPLPGAVMSIPDALADKADGKVRVDYRTLGKRRVMVVRGVQTFP